MLKATKEAKVHTSWIDPDAGYDDALSAFVTAVLPTAAFAADLEAFPGRAPDGRARPGQLPGPDRC